MAEAQAQGTAYEKTSLNTVNRKKQRGVYDYSTIHNLIDSTPVLHVAFNAPPPPPPSHNINANPTNTNINDPPFPTILPMLGCTAPLPLSSPSTVFPTNANDAAQDPAPEGAAAAAEPRCIYLHGYVASRLMRLPGAGSASEEGGGEKSEEEQEEGVPVTVSATSLDGIVLALTPFAHSCNYRSVVVFGHAHPVTSPAEKSHALRLITNNLIPHRWSHTRVPPTAAELSSTGVIRVDIYSASAKVHVGGPSDDRKDTRDEGVVGRVWTGVVPVWLEFGGLREGVGNCVSGGEGEAGAPAYLREWVEGERRGRRGVVEESLRDESGVLGVRESAGGGKAEKGRKGWGFSWLGRW